MAVKLTCENFKEEVVEAKERVLIDFWTEWCGPCRMLLPVIEEVSKEVNHAKVCKVNVDESPALADQYKIMAIPTMVILEDGKEIHRMLGVQRKETILAALVK